MSEQEIRVQVLGLLRRFEELGATVDNLDAISGLVSAAAVRAFVGGMAEKKFKQFAERAYRHARLAEQLAEMDRKMIVLPVSLGERTN